MFTVNKIAKSTSRRKEMYSPGYEARKFKVSSKLQFVILKLLELSAFKYFTFLLKTADVGKPV
jgi:hypothetical protein